MTHDIVPPHLAVKAMQDNGYKNAAYAIAELIDNSIQAGAQNIELLCVEEFEHVAERHRSRIKQIGILDDGSGMDAKTLRLALQFGNGTHLDSANQNGIGRFGMGLPCSSISQAQRVEVWTWRNGVDSAIYTWLDVDEICKKELTQIPEPVKKPIPALWRKAGKNYGESGTLVVWSRLQRCFWKTSSAIIKNSELLIGRIYRKFIADGNVKIRLASFDIDNPKKTDIEELALPNDPLYLMDKTSCPAPFDNKPMFEQWGKTRDIIVKYEGKNHKVSLTFSHARKEARETDNAGHRKHGQHAARNIGVSIVRAGRELDLDEGWTIKYDPTERWWGAEIEFPPALDELFGVTNNKQAARNFAELAKVDIEALLKGGKTIHQLRDEWTENEDPRGPLLEIAHIIDSNIDSLRDLLEKTQKGTRSEKRHKKSLIEEQATAATKQRQEEGHAGASDEAELQPSEKRIEDLAKDIAKDLADGETPTPQQSEEAKGIAATIIDQGLKYEIVETDLETPAFFSVKGVAGVLKVTLNTSHPAHKHLVEALEQSVDNVPAEKLKERLQNASDGLKLLLTAWARYEDEQPDGVRRQRAQETRTDWGRVARQFFNLSSDTK